MDWIEVTNFAIDRRFIERGMKSVDTDDLKGRLTNDEHYSLAVCYFDSLPANEKSSDIHPLKRLYIDEDWSQIFSYLGHLDTALYVIRDLLRLSNAQYKDRVFRPEPPSNPLWMLDEILFQYPHYRPFRVARSILRGMLAEFRLDPHDSFQGELGYSIKFKVIEPVPIVARHSIQLVNYVRQDGMA